MSEPTVVYSDTSHTQEDVAEVSALVSQLLASPALAGKQPGVVCNALISAYWTAVNACGQQVRAAEGMVQLGGAYLASQALAQRAANPTDATDKPVVH